VIGKTKRLYEGKAKILWETDDPALAVQEFKNDATAFDGTKHEVIERKGRLNNAISSHLFTVLGRAGVRTHFVEKLTDNEMLVERLDMLRVEVVVRNVAAGSVVKRFGVAEGTPFAPPLVEFYLKDDALHDPLLSEEHIRAFSLATPDEIERMKSIALAVNEVLRAHLSQKGIDLIDFKLEFGTVEGELVVGDEVSPDTCRLHDARTGRPMDKDRFRRDLGSFIEAYDEVLERLST
jgi:phosphoribosylaminoimidazole-succinocarboxamide synthase